jgi:hypothetical protein
LIIDCSKKAISPQEMAVFARPARIASCLALLIGLPVVAMAAGEGGGIGARTVIQRQLDAFQRGDAEGAFALASPALKAAYSNSNNFLESVRSGNTPFFHRRITEYDDFLLNGDDAAQSVVVVDDNSNVWNVVYKLSRQPDGVWMIDGVLLSKSDATDL